MNILIIGAGGVGTSAAAIIKRAQERKVIGLKKSLFPTTTKLAPRKWQTRFWAAANFDCRKIDTTSPESIKEVIKKHDIEFVMNAVEPAFNQTI